MDCEDREPTSKELQPSVSVSFQCHVMIGMHGAALGFIPFTSPNTGIVELLPQAYARHNPHSVNNIFRNLAGWFLRGYKSVIVAVEAGQVSPEPIAAAAAEHLKFLTQPPQQG